MLGREDSITVAKAWAFQLLLQNRKLLSQREILGRKFRPVTQDPTNEQHKDANQAHFAASENLDYSPKTIAEASKSSNPKLFADKAYGVLGRDSVASIIL